MTDPSLLRQELCELLKKAQDSEYNQNITTGIILYKQAKEIAQTLYEDETSNLQLKKLYESKVKDITNKINQITEISEKEHHSVGKNGVLLIDYTFNKDEKDETIEGSSSLDDAKNFLISNLSILKDYVESSQDFPTHILIYGPPGTGKTYLINALRSSTKAAFFHTCPTDLISKYTCGAEKEITKLFERVKNSKPAVVVFEDIDLIAPVEDAEDSDKRQRIHEIIAQMKMVGDDVIIIGVTNKPWNIYKQVVNVFQKRIYIGLPDSSLCRNIIKNRLKDIQNCITHEDIEEIVNLTCENSHNLYSCSDIEVLVRSVAMNPVRKCMSTSKFIVTEKGTYCPADSESLEAIDLNISDIDPSKLELPPVSLEDFKKEQESMHPSISEELLEKYNCWTDQFAI